MPLEFDYNVPVDLRFGRGKADLMGRVTAGWGSKVLIVTGRSSSSTGLLKRAEEQLESQDLAYCVFDDVSGNPTVDSVAEGAALARKEGCDCILAIGGGSPLDAAKGIALMAKNDGDVRDYLTGGFAGKGCLALPIVAVPTTCGTGSECNGTAILTDPETHDKRGLRDNCLIPRCSIVDPSLMETMPPEVLRSVTFDALCHSMESYLSPKASPVTETVSLTCIATLAKYIVRVNDDIRDSEALDAVTMASSMVGSAFYAASLIAPHGLEHPLSGLRNIAHGRGLAALTPTIFRHCRGYSSQRFGVVSRLLGGEGADDCADRVDTLLGRIGLDVYLSDEGFTEDDLPWLTENAFKVSAGRINDNPKVFDREEVSQIYRESM